MKAKIWMLSVALSMVMVFGTMLQFYPDVKAGEGIASTRDLMASLNILRVRGKVVAPDFGLKELGGRIVRLTDHRGKIVLINFWTTW